MTLNNNMRQIIEATRSLVCYCDQGQAARLSRLTRPLPLMLQDDSKEAVDPLQALTEFNLTDIINSYFSQTTQQPVPKTATQPFTRPKTNPSVQSRNTVNRTPLPRSDTSVPLQPGMNEKVSFKTDIDVGSQTIRQADPSESIGKPSSNQKHRYLKYKNSADLENSIDDIQPAPNVSPDQNNDIKKQNSRTRPAGRKPDSSMETLVERRRLYARQRKSLDHELVIVQPESTESALGVSNVSQPLAKDSSSASINAKDSKPLQQQTINPSFSDNSGKKTSRNTLPFDVSSIKPIVSLPFAQTRLPDVNVDSTGEPDQAAVHRENMNNGVDKTHAQFDSVQQAHTVAPPEDNLAMLLAEAIYLHGIDRT